MSARLSRWLLVAAFFATGAVLVLPSSASACGGFFCSQSQPVNQAAERIIFAHNDDGTVTAVVQILYNGPSESFSWVLPVPGVPDVGVSSNVAFQRLQSATNPFYTMSTRIEGECAVEPVFDMGGSFDMMMNAGADAASRLDMSTDVIEPPVTVQASGSVGPYDYEVISVNPDLDDLAQVAVDWLDENGYDVTAIGPDVLRPYLEGGMNLLAFRLTKDASAGSIRPVMMTYAAETPMIPIRPTAVAATDDMGVLAWVLSDFRAVPTNYRTLLLNDAAIDWFRPSATYDDVISLAADESGGQGFVTEYADRTETLGAVVWSDDESVQFQRDFVDAIWESSLDLVGSASAFYGRFDGFAETLAVTLPVPEGVTIADVIDCFWCYFESDADLEGFDQVLFVEALYRNVIEPLELTQQVLDSLPYITRLYTTLSAAEMTVDPVFELNADLDDVSNVHQADFVIECSPDWYQFEAPWRVELPSGRIVRGLDRVWPFQAGVDMPANQGVLQLSTTGDGEVVEDNSDAIAQALSGHNDFVAEVVSLGGGRGGLNPPGPGPGVDSPSGRAGDDSASCGCSATDDGGPQTAVLMAILALLMVAGRRREGRARRR